MRETMRKEWENTINAAPENNAGPPRTERPHNLNQTLNIQSHDCNRVVFVFLIVVKMTDVYKLCDNV